MRISDWSSDVCSSDLGQILDDVDDLAQLGRGGDRGFGLKVAHCWFSCIFRISRCTASAMPTPPDRAIALPYSWTIMERKIFSPSPPPNRPSVSVLSNTGEIGRAHV